MALHVQKNNARRAFFITSLFIVAIAFLAYRGYDLWQQYYVTHTGYPIITDKVITYSTSHPSETRPTEACNEYTTGDSLPERISIPTIGVNGCILQVGLDQHNAIAVPDNIYTAGWYIRSEPPGRPGLSVIDGHISGRYKNDAIFQHLGQLKAGDSFTITLGSGKVLTYEVYKSQSVSLDTAAQVLLSKDPRVTSQINLVTCGGTYDETNKRYDHRIIVSAELH